jgi:hypothetical protein
VDLAVDAFLDVPQRPMNSFDATVPCQATADSLNHWPLISAQKFSFPTLILASQNLIFAYVDV